MDSIVRNQVVAQSQLVLYSKHIYTGSIFSTLHRIHSTLTFHISVVESPFVLDADATLGQISSSGSPVSDSASSQSCWKGSYLEVARTGGPW